MGKRRRGSVALAAALAISSGGGVITFLIDLAYSDRRLGVLTICLVVIAAATWLARLVVHVHETAVETALKKTLQTTLAEEHVEQRLRGLRSNADSDH